MSGLSYGNLEWVLEQIEKSKKAGKSYYQTTGGPCDNEIIEVLKSIGYKVKVFSDFEIITWDSV